MCQIQDYCYGQGHQSATPLDVQYAENQDRNIISYGIWEVNGFKINNLDNQRVVTNIDSLLVIFDVEKKNNVLLLRDHGRGSFKYLRACK